MQYNEWLGEYQTKAGLNAVVADGMPHGNTVGNPTEAKAIALEGIGSRIRLIEETVMEASPELYKWLLYSVTNEGITYNYLYQMHSIPCGKKMYYDRRRKFYYLLSKKILKEG